MVKAQNEIKDSLKLIDIVVEVLDARIPFSSQNPIINNITSDKARIIVLNKADLADKNVTEEWKKYFMSKGMVCLDTDTSDNNCIKKIVEAIKVKGKEVKIKNPRSSPA